MVALDRVHATSMVDAIVGSDPVAATHALSTRLVLAVSWMHLLDDGAGDVFWRSDLKDCALPDATGTIIPRHLLRRT